MFAQVSLIKCQGRLTIQLVEDVARRPRNQAVRSKGIPAAQGAVPDVQPVSVQSQCSNTIPLRCAVPEHQRLLEAGTVAGEPTGDGDMSGQMLRQSGNQLGAVDTQAVGEYEDMHQPFRVKLPRKSFACLKAAGALAEREARPLYIGAFKMDGRDDQRIVEDGGIVYFAGSGAAKEMRVGIRLLDLFEPVLCLEDGRAAKKQYEVRPST